MPDSFEPRTEILHKAQQEIWPLLAPTPGLSFVLYGGTAVALHLGHRISVDFDFFSTEPLNKKDIETSIPFMRAARTKMAICLRFPKAIKMFCGKREIASPKFHKSQ